MQILQPKSPQELLACADIYISYNNDFLKVDERWAHKQILDYWRQKNYIRVIWHEGQIVGFIAAIYCASKHSPEYRLLQEYYCTNLKGFSAAKAVRAAHRDMIEYATRRGIGLIQSPGSHMDSDNTFVRILEKDGWERSGYLAQRRLEVEARRTIR
jgi:hypothetical protein